DAEVHLEGFTVSNSDRIHKGYERFQSLLSQLEIHGAGVSTEDANQKFLRSLPSAWLQVSLIMRNKPGMDSLSFDDLYNNLRVFENDVKSPTASSSNLQNVAFVSENTSSTNEVSTAHGVSSTSGQSPLHAQTSSYSLLASQSSCPQLDHEDLEQLHEYDLEEMDLKWQVAMISMRMKKFYKKTGRKLQFDTKEPVGFDKTKVECYNCHKTGHFARECRMKGTQENRRRDGWNSGNKEGSRSGKTEESKALVTVDGEGVDWTTHSEDDEDYALMASNSSGSDTQVNSCSIECKESYANLKRLYDAQREQLNDASVEIKAYTQGLKKVEAQLVAHQQSQLWYEQKIKFMKIDVDDKTDVLIYHKTLLAKAQKDKDDLETIVDKWNHSSKNLGKVINYQMSAYDKFGLGYGDYRYSGNLSYENEISQSVFQDDSQYTYGPEKTQTSESETQTIALDTCESNISTEPSELVSEPVVNESSVEVQPKVWSDAPIIEEYESDNENEYVSEQTKEHETPSFANKQVKTSRKNVKNKSTHSQKPDVNKKELGYGLTERAYLIRDCDYHGKMAKHDELTKQKISKGNGSGERKLTWNNVQRVLTCSKRMLGTGFNNRTVQNLYALKVILISPSECRSVIGESQKYQLFLYHIQVDSVLEYCSNFLDPLGRLIALNQAWVPREFISFPFNVLDNPHRLYRIKELLLLDVPGAHDMEPRPFCCIFKFYNGCVDGPVAFGGSIGYITVTMG
ncbi:ribonuclease H-like domain-containing protein, partial [Tanacetum coccineum]